mmetsp:Transcript_26881/g.44048  ORF Transcript_26881/g.44048 Transcript_26881/m.44048 type:complete len:244 (+) Transcript_26881:374-1105(+)
MFAWNAILNNILPRLKKLKMIEFDIFRRLVIKIVVKHDKAKLGDNHNIAILWIITFQVAQSLIRRQSLLQSFINRTLGINLEHLRLVHHDRRLLLLLFLLLVLVNRDRAILGRICPLIIFRHVHLLLDRHRRKLTRQHIRRATFLAKLTTLLKVVKHLDTAITDTPKLVAHRLHKMLIVRHNHHGTFKVRQCDRQRINRRHIQMIRRLVQQQDIRRNKQGARQTDTHTPTTTQVRRRHVLHPI